MNIGTKAAFKLLMKLITGVNFTRILQSALTLENPKSKTDNLTVFLYFFQKKNFQKLKFKLQTY
jgi:hypothetical protein